MGDARLCDDFPGLSLQIASHSIQNNSAESVVPHATAGSLTSFGLRLSPLGMTVLWKFEALVISG